MILEGWGTPANNSVQRPALRVAADAGRETAHEGSWWPFLTSSR